MGRLFDPESNIMQILTRYATVFLCGMVWFVCCIPVITAGASTTAMHRMMFNLRQERPAGIGLFFKTFIKEFPKSTVLWLIDLLCVGLLYVLFCLTAPSGNEGAGIALLLVVFFLPFFLWMFTFAYVFPLTSFFENRILTTIWNGLLISIRYFRSTIPVLALSMIPVIGFIISEYYFIVLVPIWIMIIIPLIFYFQSYFFLKVFSDLIPGKPDSSLSEGSGSVDEITG